MTIKDLMDYMQECIDDGVLTPDSGVWIADGDEIWPVHNINCDCGTLNVSA